MDEWHNWCVRACLTVSLLSFPSGAGVQRAEPRGDHRGGVRGRADHAALHGSGPAHLEEVRTSARRTQINPPAAGPSTHSIGHLSTPRPPDPVVRHADPRWVGGARRTRSAICDKLPRRNPD